jgi:hypothetical protein
MKILVSFGLLIAALSLHQLAYGFDTLYVRTLLIWFVLTVQSMLIVHREEQHKQRALRAAAINHIIEHNSAVVDAYDVPEEPDVSEELAAYYNGNGNPNQDDSFQSQYEYDQYIDEVNERNRRTHYARPPHELPPELDSEYNTNNGSSLPF